MKKLLLMLACVFSTTPAFAGDKCSPDVKVDYKTSHGSSIKVLRVEYRHDGTTVWHREDVFNHVINKNGQDTFKSQKLGDADKGSKLFFRVVFQPDTGKGYGSEQTSAPTASAKTCEDNVTYTVTVF